MMGSLYLLLAMFLVVGGLISRREPAAKLLKMALAWVLIFGAGFVVFSFRDDLGYVGQRLRAEATGAPIADQQEVRIPMAIDGHFWVDGLVNGRPVRFLVDSGASVTTIGRPTAKLAGLNVSEARDQEVQTGNGVIHVAAARADDVSVAGISRRNMRVHVADTDDLNVLGMNWLSTLRAWSVEGRWLVMRP
jgi:aspartyl protease family protein